MRRGEEGLGYLEEEDRGQETVKVLNNYCFVRRGDVLPKLH